MSLKRKKPIGSADCWEKPVKFPMSASANASPVELTLPSAKLMLLLGESGREFWSFRLRAYIAPNLNVWLPFCQVRLSEGEISVVGARREKYGPANCAGAAFEGRFLFTLVNVTWGMPLGNLPALAKGSGILKP